MYFTILLWNCISQRSEKGKLKNVQNNSCNSDNCVINTQEIGHYNQPRFPCEGTAFLRNGHTHM